MASELQSMVNKFKVEGWDRKIDRSISPIEIWTITIKS
jgi:hypothetical protein